MVDPIPIDCDESSFDHCIECDFVGHESAFQSLAGHQKTRCPECGCAETYTIPAYECGECGVQFSNRSDAEDCCQ